VEWISVNLDLATLTEAEREETMQKLHGKSLFVFFLTAALIVGLGGIAAAKDYKFAVSQGWLDNPSGQTLKKGFQDAFKEFGGEATFVQAAYDAKLQAEQIESFIKMKPDAIFVTAADTKAITTAVRHAIEAGIPVFSGDSLIAGAGCTVTIMSNNFGMGVYTMDFIAKRLKGKGNIGVIDLPSNETWDMRALGMKWALRKYPDIKIAAEWAFNPAGNVKPRQAVDNMLTAHPSGQLDAIWCAWDGAAMEGALAIKAAGRENEIFTTGIDGGVQAFEYIKAKGVPMALSMAQSMYLMAYMNVYYAHQYLAGNKVPRLVISPTYAVTEETIKDLDPKVVGDQYDRPGEAEKLGWERAL
jgi:ribose transport system substrate-binding protein